MTTSKKIAKKAGKDLQNPKTTKIDRGPIASALRQAKSRVKIVKKSVAAKKRRKG